MTMRSLIAAVAISAVSGPVYAATPEECEERQISKAQCLELGGIVNEVDGTCTLTEEQCDKLVVLFPGSGTGLSGGAVLAAGAAILGVIVLSDSSSSTTTTGSN